MIQTANCHNSQVWLSKEQALLYKQTKLRREELILNGLSVKLVILCSSVMFHSFKIVSVKYMISNTYSILFIFARFDNVQ